MSLALNIAEGAGEYARYEKHRFYRMSATECAAILDIAHKLNLIDTKKLHNARDLLFRIVSMLIKIVSSGR